jgi:hypothetical protein
VPGQIRIRRKNIRCRRVVEKNGLLSAHDGAKHRFGKCRCAGDALAQIHGYIVSGRHRFGLDAQFVVSRNN